MDRFVSNTINKVDSKGRVSIPAGFRSVLAGQSVLHTILGITEQVAEAGGPDFIEQNLQRLAKMDPFSEEYEIWSFYLMGDAEQLKIDTEGRIVLPQSIMDYTGITNQVAFVGRGHFFQLVGTWSLQGVSGNRPRKSEINAPEAWRFQFPRKPGRIISSQGSFGPRQGAGYMTDRSDGGRNAPDADGGLVRHIPVMLNEVVQCLGLASGETIIDGTFGAGGYSSALLDAGASVVAIDQDPDAIAAGSGLVKASSGRLKLVQGRFSELDRIARDLGHESVNGVVLDIGVSSMQLDEAERGFSFQKDGPLDMRMAQAGTSASDVVNFADQATLTRIIGILGEERQASRISRAIVEQREGQEFSTTLQLAKLIEKTIGRKPGDKIHPATRSFQGLRIFVNRELEELANALFAAERILKPGGRLVVVTFHSLEDRIVKRFFAERAGKTGGSRHLPQAVSAQASFVQEHRGALSASHEETEANPRSRSAKLRWGIRNEGEAHAPDLAIFGLPNLSHSQVKHRA